MTDYEVGYKAFSTPGMLERVEAHFSGKPLDRSEEWFAGFQDASDDARWHDARFLRAEAKRQRDMIDMF